MKKLSLQMIIFGIIIVVFAILFAVIIGAEVTAYHQGEEYLPPAPEQAPCQHCHIAGSEPNPWVPIYRWVTFGSMGLVFLFGVTRNLSVWKTRAQWQHRWRSSLGKFIPFFFLLQALTGIVLALFYEPSPEDLIGTPFSLDAAIRAIHWGNGILLFITTLVFSFVGAQISWYQRAYWATIFIVALVFGIPAIGELSLAYLRADWVILLSSNRLFALHLLLTPAIIASVIIIMASKEKSND